MEQFNLNWHTFDDHLKEMMQNLMHTHESTDVTLVYEDKIKFKAHQFVLKASSRVFHSIINDLPQKEPVIYLRGILSHEMKSILQFIYLGQAKVYQDRMKEFLCVVKSLQIKEIRNGVGNDATNLFQDQEYDKKLKLEISKDVENDADDLFRDEQSVKNLKHEEKTIVNQSYVEGEMKNKSTNQVSSTANES